VTPKKQEERKGDIHVDPVLPSIQIYPAQLMKQFVEFFVFAEADPVFFDLLESFE